MTCWVRHEQLSRRGMHVPRLTHAILARLLVLASTLTGVSAHAADDAPAASSNAPAASGKATAASPALETTPSVSDAATEGELATPLSPLPEPPPATLPEPTKAELEFVDGLLSRLHSSDALIRERTVRELLEVKPRWVPALRHRIDSIADRSDKQAMKSLLGRVRRETRDELREAKSETGSDAKLETPDYLEMMVAHPDVDSDVWKDLVSILAVSRMLRYAGDAAAGRSLIHVYVRFGEFLRIDTQLQLEELGDRALGPLLEARQHPAKKIAEWAERRLDLRGKAIPSEAVQTDDMQALTDVLRAFGYLRDPDAARIVISFAASERAPIREAAREAVALYGAVASWPLRDAYEDTVGKRPPREWTWKRTARELFTQFDRLRFAEMHRLVKAGQAAQAQKDWDAVVENYNRALSLNPLFEGRSAMAEGYVGYAAHAMEEHPDRALAALRRAERIATDESERQRIAAERHAVRAKQLLARGLADQGLVNKALSLDPKNDLALELRDEMTFQKSPLPDPRARYGAAALILIVSLLGAGGVLFGLRRARSPQANESTPR